jgi:putative ABC transport system ATP-binding protein
METALMETALMETVLRADALEKTFDADGAQVRALRGVTLDVAEGEFVSVMGPSGSGKSTLLHVVGGLDRPTGGAVFLRGRRVDGLSERRWAILRRGEIGFVFQFFNLIGNLSVADNVELPALLAGRSAREARRRRERLLAELGLGDAGDALPGRLSGGQQQRVAIARALVNDPAILLADEPTGNLDSESARSVLDLLRGFHERGQTIVLVTHDARVAASSQRVVSMRDGRITDETRLGDSGDAAAIASRLIQLEV